LQHTIKEEGVMVFRLGKSNDNKTTHFALVKINNKLDDFFLFDNLLFENLKMNTFTPTFDKRKYLPYLILPDLTEISFVHLGLFSGLFAEALNLDNKKSLIIPATTHSTFTFTFNPHSSINNEFIHNNGQIEIDAIFLERRQGKMTLFLLEAKNGFNEKSPQTLSKHKIVYPILAIAPQVPGDIEIIPVYVKVNKIKNGLIFNIAELSFPDPRKGKVSIDQLSLQKSSKYFLQLF